MQAVKACLEHHTEDAGHRRLFVHTLQAHAQRQRATQQASAAAPLLRSRPFASADATLVIHADKATAHNLSAQYQEPAGAMLERLVAEVHGHYDVVAGVVHELLTAKGQGHGSSANVRISMLVLHLLATLNDEKTVVLVLDADQHNDAFTKTAAALVDLGLVERCVIAFLPAYHTKHWADAAHGILRTAAISQMSWTSTGCASFPAASRGNAAALSTPSRLPASRQQTARCTPAGPSLQSSPTACCGQQGAVRQPAAAAGPGWRGMAQVGTQAAG